MNKLTAVSSIIILAIISGCQFQQDTISHEPVPNIIFILADDLGWADMAYNGSRFYETPNLDRLAREGLEFTHAYSASPVCSPTRGSIMTGKYPVSTGFTGLMGQYGKPSKGKLIDADFTNGLPPQETTIAKLLKTRNYHTWHLGKWHLGDTAAQNPLQQGFDVGLTGFENAKWEQKRFRQSDNKFITDHLTDKALGLIDNHRHQPFFLHLAYYAVHTPIAGKQEDIDYFQQKAKSMGLNNINPFEEGDYFPSTPWWWSAKHGDLDRTQQKTQNRVIQSDPVYAAFLYNLDRNVGRIMYRLEQLGIADNTMLIFFSDNGGLSTAAGSPTSNAPLREGKGWMYDGAHRVPMIIHYPKAAKAQGKISEAVVSVDFMPTISAIAGLDTQATKSVDGVSLMPLLNGRKTLARDAIYWHSPHYFNQGSTPFSAMLSDGYKYIYNYQTGEGELFNIADDISETDNLATSRPTQTAKMRAKLQQWLDKKGGLYPAQNPDFDQKTPD